MQAVFACNAYIDVQAPWALKKTDPERMHGGSGYAVSLHRAAGDCGVAGDSGVSDNVMLDQMGIPADVRNFAQLASHWYSPLCRSDYRIAQPVGLFSRGSNCPQMRAQPDVRRFALPPQL